MSTTMKMALLLSEGGSQVKKYREIWDRQWLPKTGWSLSEGLNLGTDRMGKDQRQLVHHHGIETQTEEGKGSVHSSLALTGSW